MNDRLWKKFENTGSVEDYLTYRQAGSEKETDYYGENYRYGNCIVGDTHK